MPFFGIKNNSNFDDPEIIFQKESFTNVLKKNQINRVVLLKEINPLPNYSEYCTTPLLFNYLDALNGIIINEDIKDGSLITNRHPIKILSLNHPCSFKIYTIFKEYNGKRKKLYILEAGKCQNAWPIKSYKLGIGLEATLVHGMTHTTYGYNRFSIEINSGTLMDIHYSYQIDAFDGNGDPTEIKSLRYRKRNNGKYFPDGFIFRTAVQCRLGGIKKIVVGFNDYPKTNAIIIKEYKVSDICAGKINDNVGTALTKMKLNLIKLMEVYERKCDNRAVRIEKLTLPGNQDRFVIEFL
uniref:Uncharacterized protein n=1 Tax=Panagrolaimus sp. PS1159 TaxID=55785 RepID=A0AC35FFA3_9BILA